MLTINQLASYAGVTVRAVRHYHAIGLLAEPERASSGYRRYDARAVVELIRIRTLARSGVPLARVRELLHADDNELSTAVAEIDARLRAEIRERQRLRKQIARLAAGDSLTLPPEAVDYLCRLRELGFPERMIGIERDSWILIAAHSPQRMPELMAVKRRQIEDPELVDMYRALVGATDWDPSDPRLPPLADRLAAYIDRATPAGYDPSDEGLTEGFVELIDSFFFDAIPVGRRLVELLGERGWSGWTQMKPVNT
ncbi:MAG TPA: MerR family transcriptional regulator [Actinomycetes bacterium]|nr:MerR family transcriptional regulator [Actinomycetes bacterium]